LVRLVLPDLVEVTEDPAWIEAPASASRGAANSLSALGGRVVVGRDGAALGVVRRVLVSMTAGRVVALEVETTAEFDGSTARAVLPWDQLRAEGDALVAREDADWLRAANRGSEG
jgi:sporulation protein YlmC with PRC-barrel domain